MATEEVINGVRVITDGDVTHFVPMDDASDKPNAKQVKKTADVFSCVWNAIKYMASKLTVKVRDLADPFGDRTDSDRGFDGKKAIEVGFKWKW